MDIITKALALAANFQAAYADATEEVRRKFNHAFFERIFVGNDGVRRSHLTEGFRGGGRRGLRHAV